jgi:hypothetical protein
VEFEALEPRDQGFAIAALAVEGAAAPAIAASAPRGAGKRLGSALVELLKLGSPEAAKAKLGPSVDELRRIGGGAALAGVHPSWLAEALADEPDGVAEAVVRVLPERVANAVRTGLAKLGRTVRAGARPSGLRGEIEALEVERYARRVFPHAGPASGEPLPKGMDAAAHAWLLRAPPEEIEVVAREVGIRAVARAFCGISKEDLAKLCHGLPPGDSVRLVSAVVELRDAQKPEDLRNLQRSHLKLLKAGGVSPQLFADAGLGMVAETLIARLADRPRHQLAQRLPEPLGRRLLDLSAPGAPHVDDATRDEFAREVPAWLKELAEKGIAATFGAKP